MSRHNKDRRKYLCPCGNRFSTIQVEEVESFAAEQRSLGVKIPPRLPHSCGRCCKLSVVDGGAIRYMTPAEELAYRVDFPQAAKMQDHAMATDAPDMIGFIPVEVEGK